MADKEKSGRPAPDPKDEKIENLEWSLAFTLALFGTYAIFNYFSSRFESPLIIFGAVGVAFFLFLSITSSLRKYLSILLALSVFLSVIFVIYNIFLWFGS